MNCTEKLGTTNHKENIRSLMINKSAMQFKDLLMLRNGKREGVKYHKRNKMN